jgi:hypothetical protein
MTIRRAQWFLISLPMVMYMGYLMRLEGLEMRGCAQFVDGKTENLEESKGHECKGPRRIYRRQGYRYLRRKDEYRWDRWRGERREQVTGAIEEDTRRQEHTFNA